MHQLRMGSYEEDPANLPAPIADYLEAENDYYDRATADLAPLHDELAAEMRKLTALNTLILVN